ncbi:MAG TPA: S41 family peptidase [Bryobacteraceae bacterium]|nr:S41 family peptidase [Bryobacteraceae bacterium]
MRRLFPRGFARYSLAALLMALCSSSFAQNRTDAAMPLTERAYLASRVYASLVNFAHAQDLQNTDVDAAYRSYLEKALAGEDRFTFSRATMEFLAGMHNGHTMFMDTTLMQHGGSLPFAAAFSDGKWVVTASRIAELKPGDVIESIDAETFEQFYQGRRRFISASTEQWARHALFAQMPPITPYAHFFPERFFLGLAGGRKVSVDRRPPLDMPITAAEGRWLDPGKVAYIRIPSFMRPEFQKRALELVRDFHSAAVLIVDVRGNTGGSTPQDLTSALMDRPYRWWTESTPVVLPYFRFRASQGEWQFQPFERPDLLWRSAVRQPSKDTFKGKLALLVDAGCHSACEDFTMPFKDNRRAVLFGATTAGSTGQPYTLDLGNGMLVLVGAKREMFPDGSPFEGVGIKPDVEITPTVENIRQGRDVVLEAARTHLGGS